MSLCWGSGPIFSLCVCVLLYVVDLSKDLTVLKEEDEGLVWVSSREQG